MAKGQFGKPLFYYVSFQLGSYPCVLSAKNCIAGRENSAFSKYRSKNIHKTCPLQVSLGKLYPEGKKTSQEWLCSVVNLTKMLVFLRGCYNPNHGVKSVEKTFVDQQQQAKSCWGELSMAPWDHSPLWCHCHSLVGMAKLKASPGFDLHCGSHSTVPLPTALGKSKVM